VGGKLTVRQKVSAAIAVCVLVLVAALSSAAVRSPADRAPDATADAVRTARIWVPAPRTTWQWQLTTPVNQSARAKMFDIDLFDNSASIVDSLHRRGAHVICYLDAGTYENFRPDSHRFPRAVLGNENGWPGERWLDIRRLSILEPIIGARLQLCKRKHFDGVEADNVDGYTNDTGFRLSASDQLRYNRWLAGFAHRLGLSIALKNDLGQARQLEPHFDYALDEQCFQYSECDRLQPFVRAHKAVFEVEYYLPTRQFCPRAKAYGFMSMRKGINLGASRQPCW
jgi:hypothetical protein